MAQRGVEILLRRLPFRADSTRERKPGKLQLLLLSPKAESEASVPLLTTRLIHNPLADFSLLNNPERLCLESRARRGQTSEVNRQGVYGLPGIAPGPNKSDRSTALAASPKKGPTRKISCIVAKSDECVRFSGLAWGRPFTLG